MTKTISLRKHQALQAPPSQPATFRSSSARSSVAPSVWSNQHPPRKPATCRCTDAGVEIELRFEFYGSGASHAVVTTMRQSIESRWSAPSFRVITKVGGWGAVDIDIVRGRGRSYMEGNNGTWYADNDPWSAAHEAGHIMELADRYTEVFRGVTAPQPGWEGTIMAQSLGIVTPADRQAVLVALGCNCGSSSGGESRLEPLQSAAETMIAQRPRVARKLMVKTARRRRTLLVSVWTKLCKILPGIGIVPGTIRQS